jgi:hypothetical protein
MRALDSTVKSRGAPAARGFVATLSAACRRKFFQKKSLRAPMREKSHGAM